MLTIWFKCDIHPLGVTYNYKSIWEDTREPDMYLFIFWVVSFQIMEHLAVQPYMWLKSRKSRVSFQKSMYLAIHSVFEVSLAQIDIFKTFQILIISYNSMWQHFPGMLALH